MCPSRESDEHWRRERCKQRFLHTQKKVLSVLLVLHSNVIALIQKCNLDIWTGSVRACVGKKRCCFFSLSIHKRLIPVLPSTLPAVQHLTGANVETKTCTLVFVFFYAWGHVLVDANIRYSVCLLIVQMDELHLISFLITEKSSHSTFIYSYVDRGMMRCAELFCCFFLFRGSWLLNSMEEFCGAVNSVCICVLVAKVLSKHNTASM